MNNNALVIAIETETRMRLKEAVGLADYFERVYVCHSLREARNSYVDEPLFDGVFVSNEFAKEDIPDFIKEMKENQASQDAAYIYVLDANDSQTGDFASVMLSGIDAPLLAPFSVDKTQEVISLIKTLTAERRAKRREGMIKFLIKNIKAQLSRATKAHAEDGEKAQMPLRALKELCRPLDDFDAPMMAIYYEHLITSFENTPAPKRRGYTGASNRVRQMFEKAQSRAE